MKKVFTFFLFLISFSYASAQKQESPFSKFGKVTAKDLQVQTYPIDSSANAVILSDIGDYSIVGNTDGWFSLKITRHKVVHILNKNGYDEATVMIPLREGMEITNFKAATYNLSEKDRVSKVKLSKRDLVKEKVNDDETLAKFTMPKVREGSIIEYTYDLYSKFISFPAPWYFQNMDAPILWSEINFSVPEFFHYSIRESGLASVSKRENATDQEQFWIRGRGNAAGIRFSAHVKKHRFISENIPLLKQEPYTRSLQNFRSRMKFQLISQSSPLQSRNYTTTWKKIADRMLQSEHFGGDLSSRNGWLKGALPASIEDTKDPLSKAQKIFDYVTDHYTTTSSFGIFMADDLKTVFKSGKGSSCEVNLILTAILRHENLDATPVLLSTAAHGYAYQYAPMLSDMNYVIVKADIGGKSYYLDASRSKLGFGKLPVYCYNGFACEVNKEATPLQLLPHSILEKSRSYFFLKGSDSGYAVTVDEQAGYYQSFSMRNKISKKGLDKYLKGFTKTQSDNGSISDFHIDSLDNYSIPLIVQYTKHVNNNDADILYLNPLFNERMKKNPFASVKSQYPVEMPFLQDHTTQTDPS